MRLFASLPRRALPALIASLTLAGCGTVPTVLMSDDARTRIHVVNVNPIVKLPEKLSYNGPGQGAVALLGGPIGILVASSTADGPRGQLTAEMQAHQIVPGDIFASSFARQASDASPMKFVVGAANADAQVELSIIAYGFVNSGPLSSTLYPLCNVTAVMKTPDGRIVWQATEFAGPLRSEINEGHTFDEFAKDPELLRRMVAAGSDVASHLLVENFMGREKQPSVPAVLQ